MIVELQKLRVFLVSEVFGTRTMIYVKDERGLYTADPKKDRHAKFIPRITISELEALDLHDVVVERAVIDLMKTAEHTRSIIVLNGLDGDDTTDADTRAVVVQRVSDALRLPPNAAESERVAEGILWLIDGVSRPGVDPTRARDDALRSALAFFEALASQSLVVVTLSSSPSSLEEMAAWQSAAPAAKEVRA